MTSSSSSHGRCRQSAAELRSHRGHRCRILSSFNISAQSYSELKGGRRPELSLTASKKSTRRLIHADSAGLPTPTVARAWSTSIDPAAARVNQSASRRTAPGTGGPPRPDVSKGDESPGSRTAQRSPEQLSGRAIRPTIVVRVQAVRSRRRKFRLTPVRCPAAAENADTGMPEQSGLIGALVEIAAITSRQYRR